MADDARVIYDFCKAMVKRCMLVDDIDSLISPNYQVRGQTTKTTYMHHRLS